MKNRTFRALLVLYMAILFGGTLFYHRIEQFSWIDALLFSVATSATIDFHHVYVQSPLGKLFSMLYLFVSVGVFFSLAIYIARILTTDKK
ncbi:two pore domain potassium channel family protein [Spirabiliibacterium falconis]|uniref:two pore domain potassium channel family protein n=1 Tax=Spirabiliibacterium falconis TaxID=572023 RepID=UPI001AADBD9B|nr:two pore domain potassium channel family protein [Spirabiliibacterium falconis]MBE2894983.1 two pore domain potassium channel family protein [Spirabiliibacterium falconis]